MTKKITLLLIGLTSFVFLSVSCKNLEPEKNNDHGNNGSLENVKFFVHGNNSTYDVQLKINGEAIGEGYVSDLKIFDENHPFKDELPSFEMDKLAFVLKEGENIIELKFQPDTSGYYSKGTFSFALADSRYNNPVYYFSSKEESGSVTSKFYLHNKNEEPKNKLTSLGNANASFVFSKSINYFQAFLNNNSLKSFGNAGGLTDLDLIEGSNTLEIKYNSDYEGEFIYYIQTPNFVKKVTKNISKDQLNEIIVDVYKFEK